MIYSSSLHAAHVSSSHILEPQTGSRTQSRCPVNSCCMKKRVTQTGMCGTGFLGKLFKGYACGFLPFYLLHPISPSHLGDGSSHYKTRRLTKRTNNIIWLPEGSAEPQHSPRHPPWNEDISNEHCIFFSCCFMSCFLLFVAKCIPNTVIKNVPGKKLFLARYS